MGSNISPRDSIHVAGAPNLPGLTFRRFRGELDYPVMVAVIEGSKEVDDRATLVRNLCQRHRTPLGEYADR